MKDIQNKYHYRSIDATHKTITIYTYMCCGEPICNFVENGILLIR